MTLGCNKIQIQEDSFPHLTVFVNRELWEHDLINPDQIFHRQLGGIYDTSCSEKRVFLEMIRINRSIHENLKFFSIPLDTGKFYLKDSDDRCHTDTLVYTNFSTSIGGDVSYRTYSLISSEDNYISILLFDQNRNIISGEFQATFINVNDDTDTVRFTEGEFQTSVIQPPNP